MGEWFLMFQRFIQPSSSGSSSNLLELCDPEYEQTTILQEHSATYQNTWINSNTTVRTSTLISFFTLPIKIYNSSPEVKEVILTCFQRSSIDKPVDTHSWISNWLYPGLKVNSPTFNLWYIMQWDNELWREVGTFLLWLRHMWLGSLHMTQVNYFRPRSQSAKQIILMAFSTLQ